MGSGEWGVANGEWRMANGERADGMTDFNKTTTEVAGGSQKKFGKWKKKRCFGVSVFRCFGGAKGAVRFGIFFAGHGMAKGRRLTVRRTQTGGGVSGLKRIEGF